MVQVFSNIRFLIVSLFCKLLFIVCFNVSAVNAMQDASANNDPVVSEQMPSQTAEKITNNDGVLRLEDTIRGNKEQPQVLTIVPWQLPVHQRINENTEWQLQVTQLNTIERNAFLRNLAVVNELNAVSKSREQSNTASDLAGGEQ